ncbi:MAG: hypothetical protein R2727_10720 [Bacteroidales bacterium]
MIDKITFRFGSSGDGAREVLVAFTIVIVSILAAFILSIWEQETVHIKQVAGQTGTRRFSRLMKAM